MIGTTTPELGSGYFFATIAIAGIAGLLTLATIVLWIIGFMYMFTGRMEYGPEHVNKVTWSLICIVLYIAVAFVQVFVSFSMASYIITNTESIQYYSINLLIISVLFSFVGTLFISLAWVFLIIELASEDIKKLLWLAFGISLVNSVISPLFSWIFGIYGSLVILLAIIVFGLVVYCYWKTYNRVKNREIMPILPPIIPPPFFPPGIPPQYPHQYPPR